MDKQGQHHEGSGDACKRSPAAGGKQVGGGEFSQHQEGRFQVLSEIGRGGMGAVLRVLDTRRGQQVALKRLLATPSGPGHDKRVSLFEREFNTLSQVRHPRIIRVFDYGIDDLGPFYTMELLDGCDLKSLAPLPWQDVCRIGRDVASSLAILHARGIVHRDVAPGNIRCGENGQAKLIDFGAMARVGPVGDVVGTAQFMAPEALESGLLDGRSDLFSLGATLYFGLTGQLAYPEGRVSQLPAAWRRPVRPVSALCPDVPDGLAMLIMEMINRSPLARPQSAAQVFERLTVVGGLARDESLEVTDAYLSVPTLVGREQAVDRCKRRLAQAAGGGGCAVVVAAKTGMGRSRLLDSLVIEAKMAGAAVVRADRSDRGEFGVIRRLTSGISEALQQRVPEDDLVRRFAAGAPVDAGNGRFVERWLRWVVGCTTGVPLALVVDDVHAADEHSIAALAALAVEVRRCAVFVLCAQTVGAPSRSPGALSLLAKNARTVRLGPLSEAQTRVVLASMFSEADNLDVLSSVIYRHAGGNPGLTVRAARALVASNTVRYVAGAWSLPAEAAHVRALLPKDESLPRRLAAAGSDAGNVALFMALDRHRAIEPSSYGALLGDWTVARVLSARQALIDAAVVVDDVDGFAFVREGYASEVTSTFSAAQRRRAHRSLARWYLVKGIPAVAGHHAACAADWEHLLSIVQQSLLDTHAAEPWLSEPTGIETLDLLIGACTDQGVNHGRLLMLRCRFLELCAERDEWGRVLHHLPVALAALEDRCGLSDFASLGSLEETERLSVAIAQAEQRYGQAADAMTLVQALALLPGVVLTAAAASVLALDVPLAEGLPSLRPLFPLSPAFPLVERLAGSIVACCRGRVDLSLVECKKVYAALVAGPIEGLDDVSQRRLGRFALGFLQGIEAAMGQQTVLARADASAERNPKTVARERYAYYVAIGDAAQALSSRRRLERLEISGGAQKMFPTNWETEYGTYSLTGDLHGLRRCEEQAAYVAEWLPNWSIRVELARIAQVLCGKASERVLLRSQQLCARTVPGTSDWRFALFLHFECLFEMKRYEACCSLMQQASDQLGRPCDWFDAFEMFLARAYAALGEHDLARKHALGYARMYASSGVRGVFAGRTHEEIARIALWMGDPVLFRAQAQQCAAEYRCGHNPALTARYERLMLEANHRNIAVSEALARAADVQERAPIAELLSEFNTQLSTCLDADSRLQTMLAVSIQRGGATAGSLFVSTSAGLTLAVSQGEAAVSPVCESVAREFWGVEEALDELATVTGVDGPAVCTSGEQAGAVARDGWTPLLLSDVGGTRPCGVLMLLTAGGRPPQLGSQLAAALSLLVVQHGGAVQPHGPG